jgi:hypothetical protein
MSIGKPVANKQVVSWRNVLAIHEAAETDPLMSDARQRELGQDIIKNGLLYPVVIYNRVLLDGRNRLDGLEKEGVNLVRNGVFDFANSGIKFLGAGPAVIYYRFSEIDPFDYVASVNHHRRHLASEDFADATAKLGMKRKERRGLIADFLKEHSELSDREIAQEFGVDHKTVGVIRVELVATGEIPQLKATTGKDGKTRKRPARNKAGERRPTGQSSPTPQAEPHTATPGNDVDPAQSAAALAALHASESCAAVTPEPVSSVPLPVTAPVGTGHIGPDQSAAAERKAAYGVGSPGMVITPPSRFNRASGKVSGDVTRALRRALTLIDCDDVEALKALRLLRACLERRGLGPADVIGSLKNVTRRAPFGDGDGWGVPNFLRRPRAN